MIILNYTVITLVWFHETESRATQGDLGQTITIVCSVLLNVSTTFFPPVEISWSEWSQCSKTCGKGRRQRLMTCNFENGRPTEECLQALQMFEVKDCYLQDCPGTKRPPTFDKSNSSFADPKNEPQRCNFFWVSSYRIVS